MREREECDVYGEGVGTLVVEVVDKSKRWHQVGLYQPACHRTTVPPESVLYLAVRTVLYNQCYLTLLVLSVRYHADHLFSVNKRQRLKCMSR